jgi:hypothetical protein
MRASAPRAVYAKRSTSTASHRRHQWAGRSRSDVVTLDAVFADDAIAPLFTESAEFQRRLNQLTKNLSTLAGDRSSRSFADIAPARVPLNSSIKSSNFIRAP